MPTENITQDDSLESSITNAMESLGTPTEVAEPENSEEPETGEETSTEVETETETEVETETEPETVEISAEDLELIQKLKNPEHRKSAIEALAKAEQLIQEKVEEGAKLPETTKGVKKTAREMAKEMLGDEYDLVPEKLFDLVASLIEERIQPVVETQVSVQKQQILTEIDSAFGKVNSKFDGDVLLYQDEMNKLAEELQIGDRSLEQHIERLYKLAKAENPKVSPKPANADRDKKITVRVARNFREPQAKGSTPEKMIQPNRELSLEDSVRRAAKSLKLA
jgi:hypothetical protein